MGTLNIINRKLFRKDETVEMIVKRMYKKMDLENYPWDECIAEQTKKYGTEAAPKICGYIKEKYGN